MWGWSMVGRICDCVGRSCSYPRNRWKGNRTNCHRWRRYWPLWHWDRRERIDQSTSCSRWQLPSQRERAPTSPPPSSTSCCSFPPPPPSTSSWSAAGISLIACQRQTPDVGDAIQIAFLFTFWLQKSIPLRHLIYFYKWKCCCCWYKTRRLRDDMMPTSTNFSFPLSIHCTATVYKKKLPNNWTLACGRRVERGELTYRN